ncbi:MAG: hypothetical protein JRD88_08885 [Deltaproteobacteria bacterium]|nr:hypothetical protein [Deltaproteobacteria bacterium]
MKKISILCLVLCIFFLSCLSHAGKYAYQPTSPSVKNTARARTVLDDSDLPEGFSYTFVNKVNYSPQYNTYVVGQHCYRGGPIRFDIPREEFTFYIDNKEYHPPWGGGGSVWHRFHTGARLNFLLVWLDSAYSVVELSQSACADVVLDTRYHVGKLLKNVQSMNVPVVVHSDSGKKIGEFILEVKE